MKKYPHLFHPLTFIVALIAIFFNSNQTKAQFLNVQSAESRIIRDNEQSIFIKKTTLDDKQLKKSRKVNLSDRKASSKLSKKSNPINCFDINKFTLAKNSILDQDYFNLITNKYLGKCLSSNDIEEIKLTLNSKILDNGFITSQVIVPNQSLLSKELLFDVFEGKINNISIRSNGKEQPLKKFLIIGNQKNKNLDINKVNIQNIQLNNLSINNYKVKLIPSAEVGKTDILFKNHPQEQNIFANASYDNLGNNFTGRYRSTLNFSTKDLLSSNDKIDINISDNLNDGNDSKNLLTTFASIAIPFRSYNLELSTSQSEFNGGISSSQGTYIIEGKSSRKSVAIDKIIFNNKKLSLNLGASISSRKSSSETYLTGLVNSTKKDFTNIEVFNSGSVQIDRSSSIYYRTSIIRGVKNDSEEVRSDILSPKFNFQLYRLFLNFSKRLSIYKKQMAFSSQFNGQISQDVLHGADQFAVGGFQSVRGFSENYITGDHGFSIRNSIKLNLASFVENSFMSKINISPFFDYGKVGNRINSDSGNLSGTGIGLNYEDRLFNLSATYAKSLNKSSLIDSESIENEFLYFNIRIKFL